MVYKAFRHKLTNRNTKHILWLQFFYGGHYLDKIIQVSYRLLLIVNSKGIDYLCAVNRYADNLNNIVTNKYAIMRKMKKWMLAAILICGTTTVLTSCSSNDDNPVEPETVKATDYSQKSNWLQLPEITKDVDAFYIYSTLYVESSFEEGAPDYAPLNNLEMIMGALGEYVTNASVFEESCNVFVPWYRQAGMKYASEINIDPALAALSYYDIKAALDYYFEKCNNGRPFVIAAHSQGAAMLRYVLKNYFKDHQDYYKRMVAAYAIEFFGPASYHEDDYPFFYNNIKENVAKRIATYKAK